MLREDSWRIAQASVSPLTATSVIYSIKINQVFPFDRGGHDLGKLREVHSKCVVVNEH